MTTTTIGDRAVVLGASIAGLLAARVLADRYEQVIVVERDELSSAAGRRRGVPQGRHIHALGARGQQVLDQLFPGFTEALIQRGAPAFDQLRDARLYLSGNRLRQAESGLVLLSVGRPFLEANVRERVSALPNVAFADRCDVLGLATTPERTRVNGARVIRHADNSSEEVIDADLVVDATGRGSRVPAWLESIGYDRPAEDRVAIDVGYATQTFRLGSGALGRESGVLMAPTPTHPRGGVLARLEGNRWMVTLMGILGDRPPTASQDFLRFAKSLRYPDIHDAIRDAEPLDEPVCFRFPASARRRYERLSRFPEGLVVMGDSLCSLNPIYGQGMSTAGMQALVLKGHLDDGRGLQSRKVLRDFARTIDPAWQMAVGGDLAFTEVSGRRGVTVRIGNAYIPRLHAAAAHDATVGVALLRVAGMLDRPQTLFRPGIVVRVLRHAWRTEAGLRGQLRGSANVPITDRR